MQLQMETILHILCKHNIIFLNAVKIQTKNNTHLLVVLHIHICFKLFQRYIQTMTYEQAENWKFNPFDLTKVWPHKEFPLRQVGKLIFNRNPKNYFAEVEQMAYSPAHLVPGIEASPDKMLQVNSKLWIICKRSH